MAWLPTGLTAIVVCDHGTVKRTGVRAGAGRRGHLPAPAGLECESPANPSAPECTRPGLCSAVERSGERRATRVRSTAKLDLSFEPPLATPASKPEFHIDSDRSASVADITPDLLAHGPALRLGECHIDLPAGASAPLEWFEISVEGREHEGMGLCGGLHVPEARSVEQEAQPRLVTDRECAGRGLGER